MSASLDGALDVTRFRHCSETGFTAYTRLRFDADMLSERQLRHCRMESPYDFDVLNALANFYSAFWVGAPARRGVLLIKPSPEGERFADVYPQLSCPNWKGIKYTERNAAEGAVLRLLQEERLLVFEKGQIRSGGSDWDLVLDRICGERRAIFFPAENVDLRKRNKADCGIGLILTLSQFGDRLSRQSVGKIAFNSGFFVWTEEEFKEDPTAYVPDPIGLIVEDGIIQSPPIYRRPAFIMTSKAGGGQAIIDSVGIADCDIYVAGKWRRGQDAYIRQGIESSEIPPIPPNSCRLVIANSRVVGIATDCATARPPGYGLFIDVPESDVADESIMASRVFYSCERLSDAVFACQGAISLVRNGRPVSLEREAEQCGYAAIGGQLTNVPPNNLTASSLIHNRLARIALGITAGGEVVLLHAEGSEPRSSDRRFDSEGESLLGIRDLLIGEGCVEAVALDGGGSAVIAIDGQLAVTPADRFDVMHVPRERVIPAGWCISL